eukprot:jgi/Chlat1/5607/Chrsp369S05379
MLAAAAAVLVGRGPVASSLRPVKEAHSKLHGRRRSFRRTASPTSTTGPSTSSTTTTTAVLGEKTPHRRRENVEGDLYVDSSCIDCDTCRWMVPEVFAARGGQSAVVKQPEGDEERLASLQALLTCPTNSIRTLSPPSNIKLVHSSLPALIDPSVPSAFFTGYVSEATYAASAYLITRQGGNVLVDVPRFAAPLVKRVREMGGIEWIFLSHKDDVGEHEEWAKEFGCKRIIHAEEVRLNRSKIEWVLEGEGPWPLGDDIDIIFTPGHTEGSCCLLYKPGQMLFTGDSLAKSERRGGTLSIFRDFNWYSVDVQLRSIRVMLDLPFTWVLPGHGRRMQFASVEDKNANIEKLLVKEGAGHLLEVGAAV